jgi:hypothetical protein
MFEPKSPKPLAKGDTLPDSSSMRKNSLIQFYLQNATRFALRDATNIFEIRITLVEINALS